MDLSKDLNHQVVGDYTCWLHHYTREWASLHLDGQLRRYYQGHKWTGCAGFEGRSGRAGRPGRITLWGGGPKLGFSGGLYPRAKSGSPSR